MTSTHALPSGVDFMVLLALLRRENYGYQIVKEIRQHTDGRVELLPGNLYSVLQRMLRDGLVEKSKRRAPIEGGPRRTYYRITSLGREVSAAEARRLKSLVETPEVRDLIEGNAG